MIPPSVEQTLQELGLRRESPPSPAEWRTFLAAQRDAELSWQQIASLGRIIEVAFAELHDPVQVVSHNASFLDDAVAPLLSALDEYRLLLERSARDGAAPPQGDVARLSRRFDLEFLASEIPAATAQSVSGLTRAGIVVRALSALQRGPASDPEAAELLPLVASALMLAWPRLSLQADVRLDLCDAPAVRCVPGDVAHALMDLLESLASALAAAEEEGAPRGALLVGSALEPSAVALSLRVEPLPAPPALELARSLIEPCGGSVRCERETEGAWVVQVRLPLEA